MQAIIDFFAEIGGFLWGPWTFFFLMAAGILFTLWSKFSQFTAMTHGVQVVRGIYDDPDDPGAINHFQALSAALSATIGLGNIGGVALAIAGGGPGALFWMWIIGFFGMALKTVEITLTMLYRNTDDPDNPHGGAMWVVDRVIGGKGGAWKPLAKIIGVFFCVTLIISTFTGGNMFQAWSVADITSTFWNVPKIVTGIVLAVVVGLVIIGGIKRIGSVAGRLVPFMCVLYLLSGFAVLAMHVTDIPGMLALIVRSAFQPTEAAGAFLGGTMGWAFSTGLRRALFSNEAGQGSAPIAHAAAKTDEAAREGIVGGMGPFIDTICVCTLTALVILLTGTWNRDPLLAFDTEPAVAPVYAFADSPVAGPADGAAGSTVYMLVTAPTGPDTSTPPAADRMAGEIMQTDDDSLVVEWSTYTAFAAPTAGSMRLMRPDPSGGTDREVGTIEAMPAGTRAVDGGDADDPSDDKPLWGLLTRDQNIEIKEENEFLWSHLKEVFTVVSADVNEGTKSRRHRMEGTAELSNGTNSTVSMRWGTLASTAEPTLIDSTGLYRDYSGASLTAHAFDREFPGLGRILVTVAAWLFAISTMISWSYYGEQGMIYMLGQRSVLAYKLVFLLLAIFAAVAINDTGDMEALMDLGTGAMLWANMPIVILLGFLAINSLSDYKRRLKGGEFVPHKAPKFEDVVDGRDVE